MKIWMVTFIVGDYVDGVTVRHRMVDPGIEPPVGIIHLQFSTPVQYGPGARSDFSTFGARVPSLGLKRSGHDVRHPSPSIERQQYI